MMDIPTIVITVVIVFLASFIQGLSSFGFPLLAVPLLSLFLPVQTVVPVITLLCLVANLPLLKEIKEVEPVRKEASAMLLASLVTIPVGVFCLKYMDTNYLKIMIGLAALFCSVLLAKGLRVRIERKVLVSTVVGLLAGFLVGLANVAGPVLIIFFNNLDLEKKTFRGLMVLMFTAMGVINTIVSALNGLMTFEVLKLALILAALPFVGTWLGARVSIKINEKMFKSFTLVLLVIVSLTILYSGISSL
ncbi:MAG: sulfite exporter TauE/SafE family protein [Eubacteriales bacterium]|nr:sulfite exporter TauE/SafE family protein [Eubacteriales bacterium]MDD3611661.1 sulfite exporter TauE/SafE family protein [Eubacteriales bacterium]